MEKYFACYVNSDLREKSSSGGIYPAIADYILNINGVIYASVYNDDFSVGFRRIDNKADIAKTYGSKYVQSSLGDTFKNIKKDLGCKNTVLFCGTPCQSAGLKAYLDKEKIDYSNLYTVDLFCHGVPSNKVWQKYLAQKADGKNLLSVNMRSKKSYSQRQLNRYVMEYNKKFSMPFDSIFFAFLALPLAFLFGKHNGQTIGLIIGLFICVLYWAMMILGQIFSSRNGLNGFIMMWLPDTVIGIAGVLFYLALKRK